jgi:hypothetical protein
MENLKKSKLLLVAFILGICVLGIYCLLTYDSFYQQTEIMLYGRQALQGLSDAEIEKWTGEYGEKIKKEYFHRAILFLLLSIISVAAVVLNIISWLKNNKKLSLIAGILYVLCLNVLAAPLCFIERFGKDKIKNKLLFYTMLYTFIVSILVIILIEVSSGLNEIDGYGIYFIVALIAGLICNFTAWKTDIRLMKHIAGIIYTAGILTVISGIICFVSFAKHRGEDIIKNKLLFYTMLYSFIVGICFNLLIYSSDLGFSIYLIITISLGLICNFIAWLKNIRAMKLIAGIVYTLGLFTIISGIICFISFGKHKKQIAQEEK